MTITLERKLNALNASALRLFLTSSILPLREKEREREREREREQKTNFIPTTKSSLKMKQAMINITHTQDTSECSSGEKGENVSRLTE